MNDDMDSVLICAIRYCLGRRTYMPDLVTRWIRGHCDGKLEPNTLAVMIRDIDEQERRFNLGDECDIQTWYRFRGWLKEQEVKVRGVHN